jgi:hypothetical protein
MTAGHFGLATVVKAQAPRVPLWALMFSTYLLDFIFIILVAAGIESFAPIDPAHPAYGQTYIQAFYSHSLVGAGLIALIAGWLASLAWGRRAGVVIGAVVFSHWILDLLVHRPDLPILPGNAGNLPLLGFGLWQLPVASAVVELAFVIVGAYLYYRSAQDSAQEAAVPARNRDKARTRVLLATGLTGLFMVLLFVADFLSLPILLAVVLMLLLIILCGWLDSRLNWSLPAAHSSPEMNGW